MNASGGNITKEALLLKIKDEYSSSSNIFAENDGKL